MKPVRRPILPFVIGAIVLVVALFLTISYLNSGASAAEATPRILLFPIFLWIFGVLAIVLGLAQLPARRRYVAATTPEERTTLEAAAKAARGSRPGEPLDYGTRVDTPPDA